MSKVISLSVFGGAFDHGGERYRNAWYWSFLPVVIRGYHALFPEWQIWIHHDDAIYNTYYGAALMALEDAGIVRLFHIKEHHPLCKAMLWRMKPLWSEGVEYVLCRDVDHTPTGRERQAVDEFVNYGDTAHCILDNPAHSGPMMGGLIGFNVPKFRKVIGYGSWDEMMNTNGYQWSLHGTDQVFLNSVLWPKLNGQSCIHSLRGGQSLGNNRFITTLTAPCPANVNKVLWLNSNSFANFIGTPVRNRDTIANAYGGDDITAAEIKTFTNNGIFGYNEPHKACINERKVVLSATKGDYAEFLPLVCHAWQRIGYGPVVILLGELEEWEIGFLRKVRMAGADIFFQNRIEGILDSTVAQVSRLYGYALGYPVVAYMLTSDADMLPLNRQWFNQSNGRDVRLFYANAYGHDHYPLCYIGTTCDIWREIMGSTSIAEQIKVDISKNPDNWRQWNYDEELFGKKIKSWPGYPDKCQMIDRYGGPPVDRIDRSGWKFEKLEGMVDAHMLRPLRTNYEKMEPLFKAFFKDEYAKLRPAISC